jgi:hypothetical protein
MTLTRGFSRRRFYTLFSNFCLLLISRTGFIGGLEAVLRRRIGRSGTKLHLTLELRVRFWRMRPRPVSRYHVGMYLRTNGISFSDLLLQTAATGAPPVVQTPGISPSPTLPNPGPVVGNTPRPLATHVGSSAITVPPRANYRPLPTKKAVLIPVQDTTKRKRVAKSNKACYFEGVGSGDDGHDNPSGDGSSSGESVRSNIPKRQRTSRIATRSSARTPTPDVGAEDTPNPGTPNPADDLSINTSVTPTSPIRLQPSGAPVGTTNAEPEVTHTAGIPPATDIEANVAVAAAATNPPVDTMSSVNSISPVTVSRPPSPPALSINIDRSTVPAFLLSHGKKRKVNIFQYLNEVKDPRFQQILSHFIRIEANDKSGVIGVLPTAGRPVEIGQWSSRARPAGLPDYTKGKRTFSHYVDSVFAWWSSIQPSWRSFKRGGVSREVHGDWGVLYAPRINGLLNVVILSYWWSRILEEHKPEDGVRADYERFADDVSWVFSQLAT